MGTNAVLCFETADATTIAPVMVWRDGYPDGFLPVLRDMARASAAGQPVSAWREAAVAAGEVRDLPEGYRVVGEADWVYVARLDAAGRLVEVECDNLGSEELIRAAGLTPVEDGLGEYEFTAVQEHEGGWSVDALIE